MNMINANARSYRELNEEIRNSAECEIKQCLGQSFLATGMSEQTVTIYGTPGNALGAYLNGANITVFGNAQDAVGDTMNEGSIIVHGNIGDAVGYAMRGGCIYVKGNAGYRAGIHIKAYRDKMPVIVIGGKAGSFLGEYQAGGLIIVLGLGDDSRKIVGNFPCTGMHGGQMLLRSDCSDISFPPNVRVQPLSTQELVPFLPYLQKYCELFGYSQAELLNAPFTLITPDTANPYKQMYVNN